MTHASVFSGIGGPEVAATMLGWENLFHCEINPFGRAVLDYWYPNSKSYEDITTTDFTEWRGRVNVLTGGFPCQPFSYAGKRGGATDDRYLWPYMFRCIDQVRPDWVVAENVAGITTMVEQGKVSEMANQATLFNEDNNLRRYQLRETFTLQRICTDLESHGYAVQPVLIPACAVGAPHRRDRVFIVAKRIAADTSSSRQSAPEQQGERERTEVQQQCQEQSQYGTGRPSASHAPTDSACGGEGTPRPSDGIEGSGSNTHQQSSERRAETERLDRLHAVLRHATDTEHTRLEGQDTSRSESTDKRLHLRGTAARCGGPSIRKPLADTDREGLERPSGERVQGHEGRGQRDGLRECPWQSGETRQTRIGTDGITSEGGAESIDGKNATDTMHGNVQDFGNVSRGMGETDFGREARRFVYESLQDGETIGSRWQNFPSVSPVHRGNDGLPFDVDCLTIPFSKWRTESLKAYGNAIVPQVMYEIFRAIEQVEILNQK